MMKILINMGAFELLKITIQEVRDCKDWGYAPEKIKNRRFRKPKIVPEHLKNYYYRPPQRVSIEDFKKTIKMEIYSLMKQELYQE